MFEKRSNSYLSHPITKIGKGVTLTTTLIAIIVFFKPLDFVVDQVKFIQEARVFLQERNNLDILRGYENARSITTQEGEEFSLNGSSNDSSKPIFDTVSIPRAHFRGEPDLVLTIWENNNDVCRSRLSCKYFVGKAAFDLGRFEVVENNWSDDMLWGWLVGENPPPLELIHDFDQQIHYFEVLSQIKPDDPDGYYMVGSLYRFNGDLEKSLLWYQKAYDLSQAEKFQGRISCGLGDILMRTGENQILGRELCEAAIEKEVDNIWLYYQYGASLMAIRECDIALDIFKNAATKFPETHQVHHWVNSFVKVSSSDCRFVD